MCVYIYIISIAINLKIHFKTFYFKYRQPILQFKANKQNIHCIHQMQVNYGHLKPKDF